MPEPFPELEELIDHLSSPAMVEERKNTERMIMGIIWEHRFWETIHG